MTESHVVSGLIAKHAELNGLLQHHQTEVTRIASDLAHLGATIKLFSPEYDLRTVRAKEVRQRNQYFKPGECQWLVLDIFREAEGKSLSSRQIAESIVVHKELARDVALIEQMQKNAIAVTKRLEDSGMLKPSAKDGASRTWRLAWLLLAAAAGQPVSTQHPCIVKRMMRFSIIFSQPAN